MWKEVMEVFGAVLVSLGGFEFIKWIANRRANTRKAAAEADKEETAAKLDEIQLLKDMILFIQSQMGELQEWLRRELFRWVYIRGHHEVVALKRAFRRRAETMGRIRERTWR